MRRRNSERGTRRTRAIDARGGVAGKVARCQHHGRVGLRACSYGQLRFDLETKASPQQVRRALTDFTDRRLQIWNRTLDPRTYELRNHGDNWALARESNRGSPFWVVARYELVRSRRRQLDGDREQLRRRWRWLRADFAPRGRGQPGSCRVGQHQRPLGAEAALVPRASRTLEPAGLANVGLRAESVRTRRGTLMASAAPGSACHGHRTTKSPAAAPAVTSCVAGTGPSV